MPTIYAEVPELDATIRRPIVSDILHEIFSQTNLDEDKLKIYNLTGSEITTHNATTLTDDSDDLRLDNHTRLEVEHV